MLSSSSTKSNAYMYPGNQWTRRFIDCPGLISHRHLLLLLFFLLLLLLLLLELNV